jgi:two-component system NtrC family sensor kinase
VYPGVESTRDAASRARILVMEDETGVAQALQIILTEEGYGVDLATTGQGALDSASRKDFDLLVADLRLPDMHGMDVIRRIKKSQPETEVIVITGYASVGSAVEAMKIGVAGYLPKPFTDDQFKSAVEEALKEGDRVCTENASLSTRERMLIGRKEVLRVLGKTPPEVSEGMSNPRRDNYGGGTAAAFGPASLCDRAYLNEDRPIPAVMDRTRKKGSDVPAEERGLANRILENVNEGILAADPEGTVVFFNKTMEAMLGYSGAEVCDIMPLARLLPFGEMERLKERLGSEEGREKKRLLLFETNLLNKRGKAIPVQMSPALLSEKDDLGIVVFVRNLREVRKAEQEDADPSRLLQQDKMMSLGRLAASVVHEINNPLAGILNYLRLMIKILSRGAANGEQMEKFQKYLTVVERETDRCSRIVTNLLAFSRKSKMEYDEMSVNLLLERSIMLSQHKMALQNIQVKIDLDPKLPLIVGDFNQLQQCTINLIFNAIDAMPQGGILTVSSSFRPDEGVVLIGVADSGCGIPEEDLHNIFEPFFTTKAEGKGLGLGLWTVYGIIERHKGTIEVKSGAGQGTAFTIRLPGTLKKKP